MVWTKSPLFLPVNEQVEWIYFYISFHGLYRTDFFAPKKKNWIKNFLAEKNNPEISKQPQYIYFFPPSRVNTTKKKQARVVFTVVCFSNEQRGYGDDDQNPNSIERAHPE